jgi:hypothetical protein
MDENTQPGFESATVVDEKAKRAIDHDSLVTVRLSEPPTLEIGRNSSIGPMPSTPSIYAEDYAPLEAEAELVKEDQSREEHASEVAESQDLSNIGHVRNLQDELGLHGGAETPNDTSDDSASMHHTLDDTAIEMEDSDEDTTLDMDDPRSSEETNWDQLQKIEDEESRDQDNVSDPTNLSPILVLGSFF